MVWKQKGDSRATLLGRFLPHLVGQTPRSRPTDRHPLEVLLWIELGGSNDDQIHFYLPAERYLVVLADRGSYTLPWTAYYIQHENGHQKYLQRHARYTPKS